MLEIVIQLTDRFLDLQPLLDDCRITLLKTDQRVYSNQYLFRLNQ